MESNHTEAWINQGSSPPVFRVCYALIRTGTTICTSAIHDKYVILSTHHLVRVMGLSDILLTRNTRLFISQYTWRIDVAFNPDSESPRSRSRLGLYSSPQFSAHLFNASKTINNALAQIIQGL